MIIKGYLLFLSMAFAQSNTDQRVNEHLQKTHKKIQIQSEKKEVELRKHAPTNLKSREAPKKRERFIVHPKKSPKKDSPVLPDQYDHSAGKDPSSEFEQDIIQQRNEPSAAEKNAAFIKQFKENAAKAGVKVEIDPKTLRARPVKNNGSN